VKTPIYDEHVKLGAKMTDFAGWMMPLWYPGGQTAEHQATRNACGLFDICHMGEFRISGAGSLAYLDGMLSNHVQAMQDSQAMYHLMLNEQGGVLDDCILYRFSAEDWMLVVNASNIESDFKWLKRHAPGNVSLEDISHQTVKLDLQGPGSPEIMAYWMDRDKLAALRFFRFIPSVQVDGMPVLVSRTGYTGEIGFELYTDVKFGVRLWNLLLESGKSKGMTACGLAARDTLRTEAGLPLHGHEMRPDLPAVGHPWTFAIHWDKEFIGKKALGKNRDDNKGPWILGFAMEGRRKALPGCKVLYQNRPAGHVTSGVISPSLNNRPIGFFESNVLLETGAGLEFQQEGKEEKLAGTVATVPFVPLTSRKKMGDFLRMAG